MADPDAQPGDTVEFHHSKKNTVFFLVFMVLTIGFYALTLGTDPVIASPIFEFGPIVIPNWVVAVPLILISPPFLLLAIRELVDRRPYLVLDREGLKIRALPVPIPWSNIKAISQGPTRNIINLHLRDPEEHLKGLSPLNRRIARRNYRRTGVALQLVGSSAPGGSSEDIMGAIRSRMPRIGGERADLTDSASPIATKALEPRKIKVLAGFVVTYGLLSMTMGIGLLIFLAFRMARDGPPSASILLTGLAVVASGLGMGWYFLKSGREAAREPSLASESRLRLVVTISSGVVIGTAADVLQDAFSSGTTWLVAVIFSLLLERQIRRWMKPKELTSTAT